MLSSIKPTNIDQFGSNPKPTNSKSPEISENQSKSRDKKNSPIEKVKTSNISDKFTNKEQGEPFGGLNTANIMQTRNLQVFDIDSDQNDTKNKLRSMNIVNIGLVKCPENKDVIMVSHDKKNKKFTFFDQSNSPIGYFTIDQLMKYIGKLQCTDFMPGIDTNVSADIIETFIVKGSTDDYGYDIQLISHMNSPFMGNIEMLIKLNNDIKDFENNDLSNYLGKISNKKTERKVNQCIKEFIYILLGHILKIISTVSEHIKDDNTRQKVRESLLRYSCGITYRITNYVLDQLEFQNEYINTLQENMHNIVTIKAALNKKINSLGDLLDTQNRRISSLSDKLDAILLHNAGIMAENKYKEQDGGSKENDESNIDKDTKNYDNEIDQDLEPSPTSNIIEEIFNATPTNRSLNVSEIFDSENGYNSDPGDEGKAYDYISDDEGAMNTKKESKENRNFDTDDKSEMSAIYNI